MNSSVRVRFAPSPTGPLHIGGLRTALFNYLFAMQNKGTFVLRIEDTDKNRQVQGAEKYIENALDWAGIKHGEGPYRQSERKEIYKKHIHFLIQNGLAYYAFDKAETLDEHRKSHEAKGKTFIYNWHNRLKLSNSLSLSKAEVEEKLAANEKYVVRFKSFEDKKIVCSDLVRGLISVESKLLDDKILYKSDGMPTYHFANVVDDHLMKISHVIRGEEWLPSLPLHTMLYEAFGWEKPEFAHLPLILNPTGKGKLSKRDGEKLGVPVFPLGWKGEKGTLMGFKEEGYLPEALINFLALLGWNPGNEEEMFSMNELIQNFDLKRVNSSGAKFDVEKLKWFNHKYLQEEKDDKIADHLMGARQELKAVNKEVVVRAVRLTKERASTLNELWSLCGYLFTPPMNYNEKTLKKISTALTVDVLAELSKKLDSVKPFKEIEISTTVKAWINESERGFGSVMQPARLALVGELKGVDLYVIFEFLGKEESMSRLGLLIDKIKDSAQ
jgi:glutamyl-tRNA synthetase